jgi:hypothetical protein
MQFILASSYYLPVYSHVLYQGYRSQLILCPSRWVTKSLASY